MFGEGLVLVREQHSGQCVNMYFVTKDQIQTSVFG
jgi:hypothetical protein